MKRDDMIKWFSELSENDNKTAGIKGSSLGDMYNKKFPVPPGFILTSDAYEYFIEKNKIKDSIGIILRDINTIDGESLRKGSKKIMDLIINSKIPEDLESEIIEAYDILDVEKSQFNNVNGGALDILRNSHEPPFVSVRSSSISEDSNIASFAGQHDSFLNVKGNDELLSNVKKVFASLFSERSICYRDKIRNRDKISTAVVIQKMVDSQKSGVIFTKNPFRRDDSIFIDASWGLGNGITSGKILGDNYVIDRDLNLIERNISDKKIAFTRNSSGKTEIVKLNDEISKREVLSGHELKLLGQLASKIEEKYKKPQDIEFAIDKSGISILQSRPITSKEKHGNNELVGNLLLSGISASPGIGTGIVKVINEFEDLKKVQKGNIVVVDSFDPSIAVALQNSAGIIVNVGSVGCHAAIISRELGIPVIIGTSNGTEKLKDGQLVTVDGFSGRIIEGKGIEKKLEIEKVINNLNTKIKLNIDLPEFSSRAAESGVDEVGIVRLENIIAGSGKHPAWYIKNNKIDEYISLIYKGLKKISLNFKNIWVRGSDFRSDEYSNLEGFPIRNEINPLMGYHGIRFSLKNQELLEAEFKALKEIADEFNNKTYGILLPKIISIDEFSESKLIAEKIGLPNNVKIGVMIETPASVQIINSLCKSGVDFINISTSNLTQYTLAVDRFNEDVQDLYDEMNPAILNSIKYVLRRCKKYGVETSYYMENINEKIIRFLIDEGIDSISVNADEAFDISKFISEIEKTNKEKNQEKNNEINITENKQNESRDISNEVKSGNKQNESENNSNEVRLGNKQNEPEDISYEDQILKEFESNEYNPSIEKKADIPELNEAIPISSQDFTLNSAVVDNVDNNLDFGSNLEENIKLDEEIGIGENSEENMDIDDREIGGNVFENQEDIAFGVEIEREAKQSDENSKVLAKLFGKDEGNNGNESGKPEEEALDIF